MPKDIRALYDLFVTLLTTNEDIAQQPDYTEIIQTRPFYEALSVDDLRPLTQPPYDTLTERLRTAIAAEAFPKYASFFTGALFAACAAHFLTLTEYKTALTLADRAVDHNRLDLFPQDIILTANHALNPELKSPEQIQEWLKTRFCPYPFNWVEIFTDERIYACCPTFLPTPVCSFKDVAAHGVSAVKDSPTLKKLQDSITDGSFRYCSKMHCTAITNEWLPSREEGLKTAKKAETSWPEHMMLSYDRSCNLACPSCRTELHTNKKSEQETFDMLDKQLITPSLPHVGNLYVTGTGDPFSSIHFRHLLTDYCKTSPKGKKTIFLETNGMLCDDRAWTEMGLYGHVKDVLVSMDAATEETYKIVRLRGDWKRLMKNMRFLSELRQKGEIPHFMQRFVVQVTNFREMPDFVRLGLDFGVDDIEFNMIRNFGTFNAQQFAHHHVGSHDHPNHAEFLEVLNDSIFDHPKVNLSGMTNLRPQKKTASTIPYHLTEDNSPKVSFTDIIKHLYILFIQSAAKDATMTRDGLIINTAPYSQSVIQFSDIVLKCTPHSINDLLRQECTKAGATQYIDLFVATMGTACAAQALRHGQQERAAQLLKESLTLNPHDIYAHGLLQTTSH